MLPSITVPCVLVTNSAEELQFENLSSVSTDDEEAAARALGYLMELGHTQIGVLGGKMEVSNAACERYAGVERAFREHQMPFDRETQYESARFAMSGICYAAMGRLLDKMPGLTAVFAMSDVQAVGGHPRASPRPGLCACRRTSPWWASTALSWGVMSPKLTTIRQDARRMADRGVELLLRQIREGAPPSTSGCPTSWWRRERPGPRPAVAGARSSSMRPGAPPVYTLSGQGHCPVDCLT